MTRGLRVLALGAALLPARAFAQQFTVVDITYEHKYEFNSHHRVKPSAETPANWVTPIDYTQGRVYGHLEVLAKPSNELAEFTICLEATPSYACTGSPKYSTTGVYDWNTPFSRMLQADRVDWTRKPSNVALIQKDGNYTNIEPSKIGEARARQFLPTRLRVVVTYVAPGATYKPPPGVSPDAGTLPDAAAKDAAAKDGSGAKDAGAADAGEPTAPPAPGASGPASSDAGEPASVASAAAGLPAANQPGAGRPPASVNGETGPGNSAGAGKSPGGCALVSGHGTRNGAGLPVVMVVALLAMRRSQRRVRAVPRTQGDSPTARRGSSSSSESHPTATTSARQEATILGLGTTPT